MNANMRHPELCAASQAEAEEEGEEDGEEAAANLCDFWVGAWLVHVGFAPHDQ